MGRPPISTRAMTPGERTTRWRRAQAQQIREYEAAIVALSEYVPRSFVPEHADVISRAYAAQKKKES